MRDSNLRRSNPSDLQSDPFDRSGNPPENTERRNRTLTSRFGDGSSTVKLFPHCNVSLRTEEVGFEPTDPIKDRRFSKPVH